MYKSDPSAEVKMNLIDQAIKDGRTALSEYESKQILASYGIPVTREALVTKPADPTITNWKPGGYLDRVPKDPWGNPYQYLNPGNNGEIDVYTLGRDGRPGGEGIDADIGNWNIE